MNFVKTTILESVDGLHVKEIHLSPSKNLQEEGQAGRLQYFTEKERFVSGNLADAKEHFTCEGKHRQEARDRLKWIIDNAEISPDEEDEDSNNASSCVPTLTEDDILCQKSTELRKRRREELAELEINAFNKQKETTKMESSFLDKIVNQCMPRFEKPEISSLMATKDSVCAKIEVRKSLRGNDAVKRSTEAGEATVRKRASTEPEVKSGSPPPRQEPGNSNKSPILTKFLIDYDSDSEDVSSRSGSNNRSGSSIK